MAQSHLRKVARARAKLDKARLELERAVLQAQESGESLRDIAPYAGMTHTRVLELLRKARQHESG